MKAYVLMTVRVGSSLVIQEELRSWPAGDGIIDVDAVAGTFDVVAVVESADPHSIGQLVMGKIQKLEDVLSTVTLLSIG